MNMINLVENIGLNKNIKIENGTAMYQMFQQVLVFQIQLKLQIHNKTNNNHNNKNNKIYLWIYSLMIQHNQLNNLFNSKYNNKNQFNSKLMKYKKQRV